VKTAGEFGGTSRRKKERGRKKKEERRHRGNERWSGGKKAKGQLEMNFSL